MQAGASTNVQRPSIDFSDAVRAYASVSVVMLHVLFSEDWTSDTAAWWVADVFHSIVKPAVPLFVMISGAFLLDPAKEFSFVKFWKGRLPRVFLPFLAWVVVYAVWTIFHSHEWPALELPRRLYEGSVAAHFWYVYMLIGLYLALPLLRRFMAAATQWDIVYFIVLWQVGMSLIPNFGGGGDIVVATGFTGYFIGGYWLRKAEFRVSPKLVFGAAVACMVLNTVLLHVLASHTEGYFDEDYSMMSDQGPTVALLTFLLYYLLRVLPYDRGALASGPVVRVVKVLSVTGYGMYLIHPLMMHLMHEGWFGFNVTGWTITPVVGIPLATCVTVAVTLALMYLLNLVPYLRVLAAMDAKPRGAK